MKIIFLDIDGVLNCQSWYKQAQQFKGEANKFHFAPYLVENLNRITDETGAKIVLSSTWRKGKTLEQLRDLFEEVGITGELIDKTTVLHFSNWKRNVPRGCEILHWIEENKGILGTNILNWKDYVIIDDDSGMMFWHRKNFFRTDNSGGGLTNNLTYQIINFLKS